MLDSNNPQEVPQVKSVEGDTPKCKCGGRTALISGNWYYSPDTEPYKNGIQEESEVSDGEEWIIGFKCDDCGTIQDVFIDEDNYKSRIAELEAKNKNQAEVITNFKKEILALKALNDKYREALENLVNLKAHKEICGKDDHYIKWQPKVWEDAEQALNSKEAGNETKP